MVNVELQFRRQFLLGPAAIRRVAGWRNRLIGSLHLSWHPDLEVCFATTSDRCLALLGYWVDPASPELSSQAILDRIAGSKTVGEGIAATHELTGRWALIWAAPDGVHVFHDPCGLRMVHYYRGGDGVVCASQPELIKQVQRLESNDNPLWHTFTSAPDFWRREGAVVGDQTPYKDCFRLLPNHALDMTTGLVRRYFPIADLPQVAPKDGAVQAAEAIRGSILAMNRRSELVLAITAGWDSRVLLAAAQPVADQMRFFVNSNRLPSRHPDIRIPRRLARKLGLDFGVNDTSSKVSPEIAEAVHQSITGARGEGKLNAVYFHFLHNRGRVSVNGNGSEICRQFWGNLSDRARRDWTATDLAAAIGYADNRFVVAELERWQAAIPSTNIGILDLLYWEHRMGHWGALQPAELDVAIEQLSPFNNRVVIENLLGIDDTHRSAPDFPAYRRMIDHLWPEVMSEPINPQTFRSLILGRIAPTRVKRAIKRAIAGRR